MTQERIYLQEHVFEGRVYVFVWDEIERAAFFLSGDLGHMVSAVDYYLEEGYRVYVHPETIREGGNFLLSLGEFILVV